MNKGISTKELGKPSLKNQLRGQNKVLKVTNQASHITQCETQSSYNNNNNNSNTNSNNKKNDNNNNNTQIPVKMSPNITKFPQSKFFGITLTGAILVVQIYVPYNWSRKIQRKFLTYLTAFLLPLFFLLSPTFLNSMQIYFLYFPSFPKAISHHNITKPITTQKLPILQALHFLH